MSNSVLIQGITDHNHETAIRHLLALPNPDRITVAVAFLNARGLRPLAHAIAPTAARTTFFVGIRNGITTAQGLTELLRLNCSVYVVDPGSRSILFHPKLYASRNSDEARIIVGSANLTRGGLISNIEASLCLSLRLSDPAHAAMVFDLERHLHAMPTTYPDNVLSVTDDTAVRWLLDAGRVVDEDMVVAPIPVGTSVHQQPDDPNAMPLKISGRPLPATSSAKAQLSDRARKSRRPELVWQSKPLTRRALTIPAAPTTNPTGSMLFTKGVMDIDQRHYFRDAIFAHLDWQTDIHTPYYERATAQFQIVIAGVDYGTFDLRMSHNTRTDTESYRQRNSMTQLHWGAARPLVARDNLLDRTMYLYESDDRFLIEIE